MTTEQEVPTTPDEAEGAATDETAGADDPDDAGAADEADEADDSDEAAPAPDDAEGAAADEPAGADDAEGAADTAADADPWAAYGPPETVAAGRLRRAGGGVLRVPGNEWTVVTLPGMLAAVAMTWPAALHP